MRLSKYQVKLHNIHLVRVSNKGYHSCGHSSADRRSRVARMESTLVVLWMQEQLLYPCYGVNEGRRGLGLMYSVIRQLILIPCDS